MAFPSKLDVKISDDKFITSFTNVDKNQIQEKFLGISKV